LNGIHRTMLNKSPLVFVGSGGNTTLEQSDNAIFINTSFSRIKKKDERYVISNLFMADGYTDLKQVIDATAIPGYTSEQSKKIRLEKVNLYSTVSVKTLILISGRSREELEQGVDSLGIIYQEMKVVSLRDIYWRCLKLALKTRSFDIRRLVAWLFAIVVNSKPSAKFRPSTGLAAVLLFSETMDESVTFKLNGIQSPNSFYGKDLTQVNHKNVHEQLDLYLLEGLRRYREIKMELTNGKN